MYRHLIDDYWITDFWLDKTDKHWGIASSLSISNWKCRIQYNSTKLIEWNQKKISTNLPSNYLKSFQLLLSSNAFQLATTPPCSPQNPGCIGLKISQWTKKLNTSKVSNEAYKRAFPHCGQQQQLKKFLCSAKPESNKF